LNQHQNKKFLKPDACNLYALIFHIKDAF